MRMAVLLLLAFAPLAVRPSLQPPAQATLFFDDFSGPTLDPSRWNVIVTGRTVNNEQQAYIDSPDVFTFLPGDAEGASHGALVIRLCELPRRHLPIVWSSSDCSAPDSGASVSGGHGAGIPNWPPTVLRVGRCDGCGADSRVRLPHIL